MADKKKSNRGLKRVFLLIGAAAALFLVAELLWGAPRGEALWQRIPGANLLLGFAGAWLLILLAKGVMAKVLQRPVTYYEDAQPGPAQARKTQTSEQPAQGEDSQAQKGGAAHDR